MAAALVRPVRLQNYNLLRRTFATSCASRQGDLTHYITQTIKAKGPLTVSEYQSICMTHPTMGYYTRNRGSKDGTVLGKEGDFITSPEISQTFGELLAIWYITRWQAQGMPKKTRIIELGPGRGTLMADMLRTFAAIDPFAKTIHSIDLVETSEYLRTVQKDNLDQLRGSAALNWYNSVEDVLAERKTNAQDNDEFVILLAHEFFDALPSHTLELRQGGWQEIMVDLKQPENTNQADQSSQQSQQSEGILVPPTAHASATSLLKKMSPDAANALDQKKDNDDTPFRFVISPNPTSASILYPQLSPRYSNSRHQFGSRVEVSLRSQQIATMMSRLVRGDKGTGKGAGLIVDYGDDKIYGDSFRGFRSHQLVDPLTKPGLTDLTFNVDFGSLRDSLSGVISSSSSTTTPKPNEGTSNKTPDVNVHGPVSQRVFLLSMGLGLRLKKLIEGKDEETTNRILGAAERLVDRTSMGIQYRVLGFTARGDGNDETIYPFSEPEPEIDSEPEQNNKN